MKRICPFAYLIRMVGLGLVLFGFFWVWFFFYMIQNHSFKQHIYCEFLLSFFSVCSRKQQPGKARLKFKFLSSSGSDAESELYL